LLRLRLQRRLLFNDLAKSQTIFRPVLDWQPTPRMLFTINLMADRNVYLYICIRRSTLSVTIVAVVAVMSAHDVTIASVYGPTRWANTREFRPVTGHLSDRQLGAPCLGIELFSGLPKQTVAGLRKGGSLHVLVRGATQGNTLQYRWPICDVRPYDRHQLTSPEWHWWERIEEDTKLQSYTVITAYGVVKMQRNANSGTPQFSCGRLSEGHPFALFSNDGRHRSRARVQLDGCSVNLSTEIVRYSTLDRPSGGAITVC